MKTIDVFKRVYGLIDIHTLEVIEAQNLEIENLKRIITDLKGEKWDTT